MDFNGYILREQYNKVRGLGDRLALMKEQIDWKPFVPLVKSVFNNDTSKGGRPNTDERVVVRCMLLQSWYGLTDPELEYQCNDRLSFRNFLGFPDKVPDFTTIWKIRDRLVNSGVDMKIWGELKRQIDEMGYKVETGVIQDASFTKADPGRKRLQKEKTAKKKRKKVKYTPKQEQHMDADGSFTAKSNQVVYGYKIHLKVDRDHQLIRDYDVTTAKTHDGDIDLVEEGDVAAYRDKGYHGKPLSAENVLDETMKRATRARKLNGGEQKRNKKISRIRSPGERPFAVIKRVFHGGYTYVKTLARVCVKEMFKCFAFNLYQMVTLKRKQYSVS
jgi:IS5 family transposase